ncbi:unnamed protein product [Trichogramma brassicae]|uniref:Uncharacterized protein n=1 Tax=Trichogramma brassicae TaxID=86971 RepID=A0A6H5HYA5_9HYME|nr:unnamed protein product [Trichogramma brassicae]
MVQHQRQRYYSRRERSFLSSSSSSSSLACGHISLNPAPRKEDDSRGVKEEPSETWTNAGDDYVYDLMDSCKVENLETSTLHELSTIHVTWVRI